MGDRPLGFIFIGLISCQTQETTVAHWKDAGIASVRKSVRFRLRPDMFLSSDRFPCQKCNFAFYSPRCALPRQGLRALQRQEERALPRRSRKGKNMVFTYTNGY